MKNIKLMKLILNWSVFQLIFISTLIIVNGQENKPHIILIMTDQQRGDAVGYIGNQSIKTPNIDQLASEGFAFSNAYSSTPSCTPARAALLTGMAPWNHGLLGYGKVARKYTIEMPSMLRDLGYYTYGIGKMHWFPQRAMHGFHGTLLDESGRVESEGFISDYRVWFKHHAPGQDPDATGLEWNEHNAKTYQLEEHLHPDHWKAEQAMSFIDNYDLAAPLFLKISFARPHSPYDPPQRFLDQYENVVIPPPAIGDWAEGFADYPNTREAAFGDFGEAHVLNSKKHYYALITFLDEQVGKIIQKLKDKGMYDNSLILFVSDHGDMLGDHHHWRKTYAYEGSAKVPMVIKLPADSFGNPETGRVLDYPVEIRDILPTFLDAAKGEIPEIIDGKSMLRLINGSDNNWRTYIDLEHAVAYQDDNYWCALTDGKEKYIWFFNGKEQLFNLVEDPKELKDLSKSMNHKEQLEKWRKRMISHLEIRGEEFVKNKQLVIRDKSLLYSPNYPKDNLSVQEALGNWRKELNDSFVYEDH
jgi:arylsulfatase A-like enzyme